MSEPVKHASKAIEKDNIEKHTRSHDVDNIEKHTRSHDREQALGPASKRPEPTSRKSDRSVAAKAEPKH
jgi:hypothetical protein